jgi:sn1-specific diacylglycerol lipase
MNTKKVQNQINRLIDQKTSFFSLAFRLIILSIVLLVFEYDKSIKCIELLWIYIVAYICLLFGEFFTLQKTRKNFLINGKNSLLAALSIIELGICIISMRGSILDTSERSSMQYWLYIRLSELKHSTMRAFDK